MCTFDVPAVKVGQIDTLVFQQKIVDGLSQTVISDGALVGSAVVNHGCKPGTYEGAATHCCKVEAIPNSYFFPSSLDGGALELEAAGTVILEIDGVPTRRLLRTKSRQLVQEQSAKFETDVPIAGGTVEDSGASSCNLVGVVGLALGALIV